MKWIKRGDSDTVRQYNNRFVLSIPRALPQKHCHLRDRENAVYIHTAETANINLSQMDENIHSFSKQSKALCKEKFVKTEKMNLFPSNRWLYPQLQSEIMALSWQIYFYISFHNVHLILYSLLLLIIMQHCIIIMVSNGFSIKGYYPLKQLKHNSNWIELTQRYSYRDREKR